MDTGTLCAIGRRRICREVGAAGSRRQDHDTTAFEMPDAATPDIGLGNFPHLDRRHQAGLDRAPSLELILQSKAVDDRRQHSHMVGGRPSHPLLLELGSPDQVSASDHHGDLSTERPKEADRVGADESCSSRN